MIVDCIRTRKATAGIVGVAVLAFAPATRAQLGPLPPPPPPPPIVLSYSASVPISRPVPNPCTGGTVLLTGTLTIAFKITTGGSVPLVLSARLTSGGTGIDALADGTAILDGTQGPAYEYSSVAGVETGFAETPASHTTTFSLIDFVARPGSVADRFRMVAAVDLGYLQGVPSAPVVRHIDVTCMP